MEKRDSKHLPERGWPSTAADEITAAVRVLESGKINYWTGNEGKQFEQEFAAFAGCKFGIALANGTVALELGLRVLGIVPGDEVITTSRTFIASASCAVAIGARPVTCDVDRDSQNMTPQSIREALTPATKAIVAVHLAGWPCEMDGIMALAQERGLKVLEDCAQAHGATYKGRPIGSMGDAAAFSFCQDKIMTTAGEGGMLTLNSEELFERAWAYKDHGKSYDAVYRREHPVGFRWLHETFGTNWRMTEVQAAIGRVQLSKLPLWVETRQKLAAMLNQQLSGVAGLRLTLPPSHIGHSYYKYYFFVKPEVLREGWNRNRIVAEINANGVPCFSGSCSEIYLEEAFPAKWRPEKRLPVARELGETSVMLLVHPTLTERHIERACEVVRGVMAEAVEARAMAASSSV